MTVVTDFFLYELNPTLLCLIYILSRSRHSALHFERSNTRTGESTPVRFPFSVRVSLVSELAIKNPWEPDSIYFANILNLF